MIRDITERKRAEEASRESQQQYRRLVDLSPDGIVAHCDGIIVVANNQAAKILGVASPEEIIGKRMLDYIFPDDMEDAQYRMRRILEHGDSYGPTERKFIQPDGTIIDVEVAVAPFVFEGKPAVQGVLHDITERKRADEAMRESEQRYRTLVELFPDAMHVVSDGKIVYANPAAAELVGAATVGNWWADPQWTSSIRTVGQRQRIGCGSCKTNNPYLIRNRDAFDLTGKSLKLRGEERRQSLRANLQFTWS